LSNMFRCLLLLLLFPMLLPCLDILGLPIFSKPRVSTALRSRTKPDGTNSCQVQNHAPCEQICTFCISVEPSSSSWL
jgi:hypothetical protein